ncbi:uncharacterized protein V1513DRAFT_450810 [Lipomyces chichibuensis]|uniref:uncharacterized protein n=1 Tax=Lipomyces chichibuensis TaxID=1546026 RepID=UPI00334356B5
MQAMSATTASSTHSQIHALLDVYQSLTSRYNPSNVTFKLEIYNDADLSSDDIVQTEALCTPTANLTVNGNPELLALQSSSINNSRRPLAILYADITTPTETESPADRESSRQPLLSYAEMRAILAGHSDDEEYTRYQSESSDMDPQPTADSEIFLTTRSKVLYGDIEKDAKLSVTTESDIPEVQEKAPQLELPEFEQFAVEDLLDSVIAEHDNELGSVFEAGRLSASSKNLSFGQFDFSKVTPRSRFRQRALKLRRCASTNFSPMIDRTERASPWYAAAVGRRKVLDYGWFHPDISWSAEYRYKQVLRELSERFRLQQYEREHNQDGSYSCEYAPLSLQLLSGDAFSPAGNVREYVPFNSPQTPVRVKVFSNGMQRSIGKLQLSRLAQHQSTSHSPDIGHSSIIATPPLDRRSVGSIGTVIPPRHQAYSDIADDQRTDTFSSIHAETGSTTGVLKTYSGRRLTWSKISGKSTTKYSFRNLLARPVKVQYAPFTPLSQLGSFITTEYVRSSESISRGSGHDREKSASLTSPVRVLLQKLNVKRQLKAAAKGAHIFRSLSSRRILSRRAV